MRYHLDALAGHGLLQAHGQRRGRYYTPATGGETMATPQTPDPGTHAIIGEIYERGGRLGQRDLRALVKKHGYDGRTVGALHGRRLAYLRKDAKTGESVLTSRGTEVARQHLFASRLMERAREPGPTEQRREFL